VNVDILLNYVNLYLDSLFSISYYSSMLCTITTVFLDVFITIFFPNTFPSSSIVHGIRDIIFGFFLFSAFYSSCDIFAMVVFFLNNRVVKYEMQNLEIPTIHVLGALLKSGIRVLVYR
jgi:hypothetical protein